MSYIHRDVTFPSSDGKNTIHAELFIPSDNNVSAVVQISHGMMDYVGRYRGMAEALCASGIALCGHDHLGHGDSVKASDDYGFFASRGGYRYVIDDVKRMNDLIRKELPGVPVVLLGHSMGSFIARLYAVDYSDSIDGLIIHGTAGPNPATGAGLLLRDGDATATGAQIEKMRTAGKILHRKIHQHLGVEARYKAVGRDLVHLAVEACLAQNVL